VRGTQSLIRAIGECWRRPGLLALELAWRWGFGLPALALLTWLGVRLAARIQFGDLGLDDFSLQYPLAAAQITGAAIARVGPPVLALAFWLVPCLAVGWAVASGVGRGLVLRRMDPEMRAQPRFPATVLILLQLARIVALGGAIAGWWFGLRWAAAETLGGAEPNLVGYLAWAICLSLGAFAVWALLSWILSIAPMIVMLESVGFWTSLGRSLRLGGLAGKLAEVNLSLGIVKLILVALAIVLSVTPIPLAPEMQGLPLYVWWAVVTVVYLIASDFFQVARLVVFVHLWRAYHPRAVVPLDSSPEA
jgi:hypothetical protein